MIEDLVRRIAELERRLDTLDRPEQGVYLSDANVSNPPTDAEIDAIWVSPAAFSGVGFIDDNNAHINGWLVISDGNRWWYWNADGFAV